MLFRYCFVEFKYNHCVYLKKEIINIFLLKVYFFFSEYDYGRKTEKVVLPTAPRAARVQEDDSKIPQDPPYMAYLTNLPYDVNEEELINFFQDMKVNVKVIFNMLLSVIFTL